MKARAVVLVVGISAILALGGYAAWKSPWVRARLNWDTESPEERNRAASADFSQPKPAAPATVGWPQWRGPNRDGIPPEGRIRTDWDKSLPRELWRQPIGAGYGSCTVVGNRLYVQDRQGDKERVVCLDAETGKPVWEYAYDAAPAGSDPSRGTGPRATPAVEGKHVYTVGGSGKLLALEADGATVAVRWQHDLLSEFGADAPQWGVACSPLLTGDMVVVQPGGKSGSVVAFEKGTGGVKWKAGANPSGYSSPVIATVGGKETIFAFTGDALLAIRPTDGKVTGSHPFKTSYNGNIATPLVLKDYVFISAAYHMGSVLLRADVSGDEVKLVLARRQNREFQNHHATSVHKGDYLYGFHGQETARMKCFDLKNWKEKEDWDAGAVGKGTVVLANDYLIVQTERGDLALVEANPEEFKLVAKMSKVLSGNSNWASPTLVDGRIYLRDEQNVVCLDVRP